MLTKEAGQVETVWEAVFPELLQALPEDLARVDRVFERPEVIRRFEQHWGRANLKVGRPSMAIASYLRMMLLKHRYGWGYERLVAQVGDSFQLRRFCRISIMDQVPDESTIRKLTRRLGPELVDECAAEEARGTPDDDAQDQPSSPSNEPFCRRLLTAVRNRPASAPSTTRWS